MLINLGKFCNKAFLNDFPSNISLLYGLVRCTCLLPLSLTYVPLYLGNIFTMSIISGILPANRACDKNNQVESKVFQTGIHAVGEHSSWHKKHEHKFCKTNNILQSQDCKDLIFRYQMENGYLFVIRKFVQFFMY